MKDELTAAIETTNYSQYVILIKTAVSVSRFDFRALYAFINSWDTTLTKIYG